MSAAPTQMPLEFRLLGQVDLQALLELQSSIQREVYCTDSPKVTILLCEHPRIVTVGRDGSRAHIRLTDQHLQRRRLPLRWTPRRGGCIPHAPGQLAAYAIAPLEQLGLQPAEFQSLLIESFMEALRQLRVSPQHDAEQSAIWGRSGVLAVFGQSVEKGISGFGGYLNVNPDMSDFAYVDSASSSEFPRQTMGSLISENRSAGRMAKVRSSLIEALAAALDAPRYHLITGHPMLRSAG